MFVNNTKVDYKVLSLAKFLSKNTLMDKVGLCTIQIHDSQENSSKSVWISVFSFQIGLADERKLMLVIFSLETDCMLHFVIDF